MEGTWRKLWSNVSLSRKVNRLSNDAALFWTWAIPHFSVHGFLEYDPQAMKALIVPLRKNMPMEAVPGYVFEILTAKLWIGFKNKDGKILLYDPRWHDLQTIRKDRVSQPIYNIKEMAEIGTLLPDTPGVSRIIQDTPGQSGTVLVQDGPGVSRTLPPRGEERRGEESREEERRLEESAAPEKHLPVDNSEAAPSLNPPLEEMEHIPFANGEKNRESLMESLFPGKTSFVDGLCISIIASDPTFNPYQWITMNRDKNPNALVHSLKRLKDAMQSRVGTVIKPWAYIEAVVKEEEKNYNAQEFDNKAQKDKFDFKGMVENLKELHDKAKDQKNIK